MKLKDTATRGRLLRHTSVLVKYRAARYPAEITPSVNELRIHLATTGERERGRERERERREREGEREGEIEGEREEERKRGREREGERGGGDR